MCKTWGGHGGPPLQLLLRFLEDRVVDGDVVFELVHLDQESERLESKADLKRSLQITHVFVILQVHFPENGTAAFLSPRHVPTHEQSILNIEEQLFGRSSVRLAFYHIHLTSVQSCFVVQLHALEERLDFSWTIDFRIAVEFRDLLRVRILKSTGGRLHPTRFPIESLLENPDTRKLNRN